MPSCSTTPSSPSNPRWNVFWSGGSKGRSSRPPEALIDPSASPLHRQGPRGRKRPASSPPVPQGTSKQRFSTATRVAQPHRRPSPVAGTSMTQSAVAANQGTESFAALFEESLNRSNMRAGEVITAEVVRVEHNFVVVNAGLKSEAYVPIDEFKNDQGELEVQVGDYVSVAIDAIENGYGDTILSRDKAKRLASWLSLERSLESGDF